MPASSTRILDSVIDWLEQLSRLVKPAPWRKLAKRGVNLAWRSLLFECSESLGLTYPACFAKPDQATRWILTVDASAPDLGAGTLATIAAMDMPAHRSYWGAHKKRKILHLKQKTI